MNQSTTTTGVTATPDETSRARELITLGIAMDPESRSNTLARLIAASVHDGAGTALGHFAGTGKLAPDAALSELNRLRVPFEQEVWVDALGRYILLHAGDRS